METKSSWVGSFESLLGHAYSLPPDQGIPHPLHTSSTLTDDNPFELEKGGVSGFKLSVPAPTSKPPLSTRHDLFVLSAIFGMLVWPWIFFGIVWKLEGVELPNDATDYITTHAQATSFVVTLIGNMVCFIINILFSIAITRFGQEWIRDHTNHVHVFHVSLLSAFRYQNWPWKVADLKYLFVGHRWFRVALVAACITTFAFVPSSTTSLLTPVHFNRTDTLTGAELDFSSSEVGCLDWYKANKIPNNCDWQAVKGAAITNCLGQNQLVDVLESGRSNLRSLASKRPQSLVLSQLGEEDGLHFLGRARGVLPMGPNGVSALEPVFLSRFRRFPQRPYNYTLEHQGFASTVNCAYEKTTPVKVSPVEDSKYVLKTSGTCDGAIDFMTLANVVTLNSVNSNNSLVSWACKTPSTDPQGPSYTLYLRGRANYKDSLGNITCNISPVQPATFPVTYRSIPATFSSGNETTVSGTTFPNFVDVAMMAIGNLVAEAQNFQSNLVAESVFTAGTRAFNLDPNKQSDYFLRLYELMIQGFLDYELTYTRLIYSTKENIPPSCLREVNGILTYDAFGWHVSQKHIGFLLPMSALVLAAMIILLIAMRTVRRRGTPGYDFDPTDPGCLIRAAHGLAPGAQDEWADNVKYRTRETIITDEITMRRPFQNEVSYYANKA